MKTLLPLLMVLAVGVAHAQADFSPKPVRIISPYPPGGAADALARQIAAPLGKRLNQSVVVENRPGAGGTIGANACKSSPPDGFTYCMFLTDIVALNPYTFKRLACDADRDFIPVAAVASLELVIVGPATGPGTLKEALAFAKANPGKVNWASFGIGTSAHLLLERIKKSAGVDIQHIPYQGGGPAVNALLSNEVQLTMLAAAQALPHIQSGKMKALAALGNKRLATFPEVATLSEQGIDFTSTLWLGLFAPVGSSPGHLATVNRNVNEILTDSAFVQQVLAPAGYLPIPGTPQSFAERIRRDQSEWGGIARGLNLALE